MKRNRFIYQLGLTALIVLTLFSCGRSSSRSNSNDTQPSTIITIPDTLKPTLPPLPQDGLRNNSAKAVLTEWVKKGSEYLTTSTSGVSIDGDTIKIKTDTDTGTPEPQLAWVQYKYDDWDTSVSKPASILAKFTGPAWDKNSSFYVGSSNYSKGFWEYTKANSTAAGQSYNTKYSYLSKSNNHYIVLVFFGSFDLTIESASITPSLQGSAPNVVSDLTASNLAYDSYIEVKWSAIDSTDHYYLSRSDSSDGSNPISVYDSPDVTEFKDMTVEANKEYYYSVVAENQFGKGLNSAWVKGSRKAKAGEFPPTTYPANLKATPNETDSSIELSCDVVDDASYYQFYRSLWPNDPNRIMIGSNLPDPVDPKKPVTLVDKKLLRNVDYYYSVKACNGAGKSDFSPSVSSKLAGKPPQPEKPKAPKADEGLATDHIHVTWELPKSGIVELWRSDDPDGTTPDLFLGEYGKDEDTYDDKDGVISNPSVKYFYYRIRVYNSNNTSEFSSYDLGYTTSATDVPLPVEDLVAEKPTDTSVVLKWSYSLIATGSQKVDRWWIYVSTDATDKYPSRWISTSFVYDADPFGPQPQTYTVKNLKPGLTYYFYVKGENAVGKSKLSNVSSILTTGLFNYFFVSEYWPKHLKTYDNLDNFGDTKVYDMSKPLRQYDSVSGTFGHLGGGAIGVDRTLYLNTRDGKLLAFGYTSEEKEGVKWTFDPRTDPKATLPDTATVVSAPSAVVTINSDNVLYTIQSTDPAIDGFLYCINRDGTLKWEFNLGKTPVTDTNIGGITIVNDYILVAVQDPASTKRMLWLDMDGNEKFAWEPKDKNLLALSPITNVVGDEVCVVIDSSFYGSTVGSYPLVVKLDKGEQKWVYNTVVAQANRTQLTKSIVPTRLFVNDIGTKYLTEINDADGTDIGSFDLKTTSEYLQAPMYVGIINPDTDPVPYLFMIGKTDVKNSFRSISWLNIEGKLPSSFKKSTSLPGDTNSQLFSSSQYVYVPMGLGAADSIIQVQMYTNERTGSGDLGNDMSGCVMITDSLGSLISWGPDDILRIYEGK